MSYNPFGQGFTSYTAAPYAANPFSGYNTRGSSSAFGAIGAPQQGNQFGSFAPLGLSGMVNAYNQAYPQPDINNPFMRIGGPVIQQPANPGVLPGLSKGVTFGQATYYNQKNPFDVIGGNKNNFLPTLQNDSFSSSFSSSSPLTTNFSFSLQDLQKTLLK